MTHGEVVHLANRCEIADGQERSPAIRLMTEVVAVSSSIEPARGGPLKKRVVPSVVTFVVAGFAVYATVWLALGVLRHIVMPILAVVVAFYLAREVYRYTGRQPPS